MSLLQSLGRGQTSGNRSTRDLYRQFGVIANPFPPAGQPAGHPHKEVAADKAIFERVQSFTRDHISQVIVVEGEQGVGKTNMLAYYDVGLRSLVDAGQIGRYVVRYYADPEPSFEGVLSRLFQELGERFVAKAADALKSLPAEASGRAFGRLRNPDVVATFRALARTAADNSADLPRVVTCAFEWLTGQRLLNRHRETLQVLYRVDTLEAKTQILRDLVELGRTLNILDGVILLLDELEKQDYTTSKGNVLRFLLAIRALIDALPQNLFLMVALTPTARNRYFQMVPAVQSRMQNTVQIKSFMSWPEACDLYRFYSEKGRERGKSMFPDDQAGKTDLLDERGAQLCFLERQEQSRRRGLEGVTPRDFLDELHTTAERNLNEWTAQAG